MPTIDWTSVPTGILVALLTGVFGFLTLWFGSRLASYAKLRERQEAADVQRETDDHNDLITFRKELQEEGTRRLEQVRLLELEVNNLRTQLLAERENHGTRIAELESKLRIAETALRMCQEANAAITGRPAEG